jgi:uncharacterized protein (DUF1778 family)
MAKTAKDQQINIRMTQEEKEQLERDANDQQRSISNLLLWCWREWRKKKRK